MYNYHQSSFEVSEGCVRHENMALQDIKIALSNSTNKYVYIKQNCINPSHTEPKPAVPKVLVNPNFNKKVFVNPNFNMKSTGPISQPKIHVNPNVQKLNLNVNVKDCGSVQKIHINPNVLRNMPITLTNNTTGSERGTTETKNTGVMKESSSSGCVAHSTGNKSFHVLNNGAAIGSKPRKRRSSIRSKFKIVKSSLLNNSLEKINQEKRTTIRSKYKIIKSTCTLPKYSTNAVNKFKVDNRKNSRVVSLPQKNKKYVYVNRFLSISDIARNNLLKRKSILKKSSLINISGILYKKSPNCLRRTSSLYNKIDNSKKIEENTICKSKFKFIKKTTSKTNVNVRVQPKLSRTLKAKKNVSPGKLRKCNIPCPYYRKYGRCKGKDNGKCYRKHDPDQIALCTKFLQGACVDEKCLLSHNVSSKKMPTCKFYLEGSCSRDDCPYLHVRINPKAEICKDFLEGFCRKAAECDKRHQFLCPDYEKSGSCLKQRCPYPHGNMVRKYSVFNKNKFAKKSSDCKIEFKNNEIIKDTEVAIGKEVSNCENSKSKASECNVKNRYYIEQNIVLDEKCQEGVHGDKQNFNDTTNTCDQDGLRSRPKLGKLPSFIALEEL